LAPQTDRTNPSPETRYWGFGVKLTLICSRERGIIRSLRAGKVLRATDLWAPWSALSGTLRAECRVIAALFFALNLLFPASSPRLLSVYNAGLAVLSGGLIYSQSPSSLSSLALGHSPACEYAGHRN
jgi:hypothetical protein